MWLEHDYLKAKNRIDKEVDPYGFTRAPVSTFDRVMVGVVWLLIGAMAVGFLLR